MTVNVHHAQERTVHIICVIRYVNHYTLNTEWFTKTTGIPLYKQTSKMLKIKCQLNLFFNNEVTTGIKDFILKSENDYLGDITKL